jgi:hypothetical protein
MMDKKDAIDYLLYMKHDVLANSPYDVALDTAIEALKAIVNQPKTNGDRIRNMTDEELSAFLGGVADNCSYNACDNCPMYGACVDVPLSRDKWLKQEVSEDAAERTD